MYRVAPALPLQEANAQQTAKSVAESVLAPLPMTPVKDSAPSTPAKPFTPGGVPASPAYNAGYSPAPATPGKAEEATEEEASTSGNRKGLPMIMLGGLVGGAVVLASALLSGTGRKPTTKPAAAPAAAAPATKKW